MALASGSLAVVFTFTFAMVGGINVEAYLRGYRPPVASDELVLWAALSVGSLVAFAVAHCGPS